MMKTPGKQYFLFLPGLIRATKKFPYTRRFIRKNQSTNICFPEKEDALKKLKTNIFEMKCWFSFLS